ncbi:MAG: F0F1 ATP synthase subunit delta [bacterium]|nr:F0F1 ATP synthase subunit delta [bacterium]
MKNLFPEILQNNYTKSSALLAVSNLREEVTKGLYGPKPSASIKGLKRDNATEVLTKIKKQIEAIEPLFITLALQLPEEKLAEIAQKLRKIYGAEMLFEFKVDPLLLAGCQLVYKGKLVDYSFKSKLASSHSIILETMNKYK